MMERRVREDWERKTNSPKENGGEHIGTQCHLCRQNKKTLLCFAPECYVTKR